jgi:hypothetical protein
VRTEVEVLVIGADPARGPWLAYLLHPRRRHGWLAVGWRPAGEAAGVRRSLPLELGDRFHPGPLGPRCARTERCVAVLVAVAYEAASLPPPHRLLNDLHAMVMLRDLLADQAG